MSEFSLKLAEEQIGILREALLESEADKARLLEQLVAGEELYISRGIELVQLEAENAELKRYVFHKIECELSPKSPVKYSAKCTCGLHALLTAEESE